MTELRRATVVGAGTGGLALAAAAAVAGAQVTILDRDTARIASVRHRGGIRVAGVMTREVAVAATTNPIEALRDVELVMLAVLPRDVPMACAELAPHLPANGRVLVSQAHFGAALAARHAAASAAPDRRLVIAESATFPFACVADGPAAIRIVAVKNKVPVAVLPADDAGDLVTQAARLIPAFVASDSVLHTSLSDVSASVHVPAMLANTGRIEHGEQFDFFADGLTSSVGRLAWKYDRERVAVAAALGISAPTVIDWIFDTYGVACPDSTQLGAALHKVFGASAAPKTLTHRYLSEDLACITVPTLAVAEALGLELAVHRALIAVASVLCGEDFNRTGRTAETLGIDGYGADQLRQLATGGTP